MNKSEKILKYFIGILFLLLYMLVATISAICSIDFFNLSHSQSMSICLAVAFELGAMCSLCAGVFMKSNRTLSFGLFTLLTLFQMMGNVFHSYTNLADGFISWVELFGLNELELIAQKRIVSIVSGAVLPVVALGFIKCFVDYNDKPENELETKSEPIELPQSTPEIKSEIPIEKSVEKSVEKLSEQTKEQPKNTKEEKTKNEETPKQDIISKLFQKNDKKPIADAPAVEEKEYKNVDIDPATMI